MRIYKHTCFRCKLISGDLGSHNRANAKFVYFRCALINSSLGFHVPDFISSQYISGAVAGEIPAQSPSRRKKIIVLRFPIDAKENRKIWG